jgi:thiol-disulfide isomerase/thioredoxin
MKKLLLIAVCALSTLVAQAQYTNTKIVIGEQAPELVMKTPKGDSMKLSDAIKGKVVLLDFWASWCGPCRQANPAVVKMYNEYKGKKFKDAKRGFTVLSVSLDQNDAAWKAAIAKDGLIWPGHMSDLGGWGSAAARVYGLSFIPQCFLIDGTGAVIGKYMHAEEALADLKKLLR